MKLLSIVLFFIILHLAGCITPYDSYEYRGFVQIAALADKRDCSSENINRMVEDSRFLYHYSAHRKNDDAVVKAAQDIHEQLKELHNKPNSTIRFCELRMDSVKWVAELYAGVIGRKQ